MARKTRTGNHRLRARRSSRKRMVLRFAALVLLTGVGVGAGYSGVRLRQALQTGEVLAIRSVEISGNKLIPESEVVSYSGLAIGDGLYSFNAGAVADHLGQHPLVGQASIIRRPPHQVRILLKEEKPLAYVALGRLYAVNAKGELFARAEALGGLALPVITGLEPEQFSQGDVGSRRLLTMALQVLGAFVRNGFSEQDLASIHVEPMLGAEVTLHGEIHSVHLGKGRFQDKLSQLAKLREYLQSNKLQASQVYLTDGPDPRRVVVRLVTPQEKEIPAGDTQKKQTST